MIFDMNPVSWTWKRGFYMSKLSYEDKIKKAPLLLTIVCSIGASWVSKGSPLAHIPSWQNADLVVCYYLVLKIVI